MKRMFHVLKKFLWEIQVDSSTRWITKHVITTGNYCNSFNKFSKSHKLNSKGSYIDDNITIETAHVSYCLKIYFFSSLEVVFSTK